VMKMAKSFLTQQLFFLFHVKTKTMENEFNSSMTEV
jgi:hypothetical protein